MLDPKYTGFQSLPQELSMPRKDLLKARREFYEEGSEVAEQYMKDYIGTRRAYYHNKKDNRDTMLKGVAFFIVTCFADWAVCSL